MIDDEREGITQELEGLHEWALRDAVIDGIQSERPCTRMFVDVVQKILI